MIGYAIPAAAQPGPNSGTPTLRVKVPLTLVDVTVADVQGHPVHGLMQADFTLKEDDKPQPLKSFEEYGAEKPQTAAPLQLPPNVYSNAQPPAPTSGAVDILMFDNLTTGIAGKLFAAPDQVMYEKDQAIRYLAAMPPGTQVAIMELGDGLRVVQSFSSDRNLLLATIHGLVYQPVPETSRHPPSDPVSREEACNMANTQSELVLNGLDRAAAFLAGVKDRPGSASGISSGSTSGREAISFRPWAAMSR